MSHEMEALAMRVATCEQDNQRLRTLVRRQNRWSLAALLAVSIGSATATVAVKDAVFGTIQASDITIVDQNGVVRARMSGDMPDATMFGGRVARRGAQAAGFMIYDKDGIERGGYVTFDHDNAMLSLDSKYHMVASLIAGPGEEGTAVLNLASTHNAMELRSDSNGSRMSVSKDRVVQQQMPAIDVLSADTCTEWRELDRKHPNENVCRTRYLESTCQRCLHSPPPGSGPAN
jgi:hypothetical protein